MLLASVGTGVEVIRRALAESARLLVQSSAVASTWLPEAMSDSDAAGLESRDESGIEALDDRDIRALTERLTVMPDVGDARGGDDLFTVISHTGSQYLVDLRLGSCSCPDSRHRDPDGGCKHVRRTQYVTGERSVPTWVDPREIDDVIGVGVDTSVAADGGNCEECEALGGDFPCAECYITGDKQLPDE